MKVLHTPARCLQIGNDEEVDDDGDVPNLRETLLVPLVVLLGFITLYHLSLLGKTFVKL